MIRESKSKNIHEYQFPGVVTNPGNVCSADNQPIVSEMPNGSNADGPFVTSCYYFCYLVNPLFHKHSSPMKKKKLQIGINK